MININKLDWMEDFSQFKKLLENQYGDLERLANQHPEFYAHEVISHGFMNYVGATGLFDSLKVRVASVKGSYNPDSPEHSELLDSYLKGEYVKWFKKYSLPENLLELGWETFLED